MARKETQAEKMERLERRDKLMLDRFLELAGKKFEDKTQFYSDDTILEILSREFHLSPGRIDDILNGRARYKKAV